jgi:hypothetical protein
VYYSVVESYQGEIAVASYLCDSKKDERRAALSINRKVHHIGTDHDEAQRVARKVRAEKSSK